MPFFCNFTSKGCSGALILGKQLTYKSAWAHHRYWEIIQHNCNNSENQSPEKHALLHAHKKTQFKANVCCTIRSELKTIFWNLAQIIVLDKSKSHVGKSIERKLGINPNGTTFWKKLRFHENDIQMLEFKHPNITETRYCLLNRAQTAQWQKYKFSFTLAGSKVFGKSRSVANLHPKCVQISSLNLSLLNKCSTLQRPIAK